ncbi:MAG TPA: Ni-sirohydrochlorin a,c-diamide synthase [Methanocorpusculum sp.]|nr:Ni-sirohydrochlorin a,c-diamide synthase [Methanocorpusculum sp.]
MKAVLFAGNKSGCGKTSITLAVASFFAKKKTVQTFKTATDYIDASYLAGVTHRHCYNLDTYVQGPEELKGLFAFGSADADISIIEGVRGLFEGVAALSDAGSTASVAKLLDVPVILIIDARSITRSAAALVLGFQQFDPRVKIAGVILNNTGHGRHAEKAKEAIEHYCGIPVLGAIPRNSLMNLSERHLGLVPFREAEESQKFAEKISGITEWVTSHLDMEKIEGAAKEMPEKTPVEKIQYLKSLLPESSAAKKTVAIAYDEAFCFYYGELETGLASCGCKTIRFSPLHDTVLPEADGYFFGGGYPELFAEVLSRNRSMRQSVKEKAEAGAKIYAECGGLMYLMEKISLAAGFHEISKTAEYEFCGVFKGTTKIPDRKRLGYVKGCAKLNGKRFPLKGHEFHYSSVTPEGEYDFSYTLERGFGIADGKDGMRYKNVLAAYTHLMPVSAKEFFREFFCGE